ncbi:SDR family NAD(P)-dependent oxidoreductase [Paenibacillus durus]|uniref:SDR family NAD(P)-dependent oxidoreductase n=1 Tax=Paenibacillus durus TaxID=44251 RepID=UPI0005A685AB|nr:SDR family NAD(P)-dependent oxidoreductase [Paenibacillus durus]
MSRKTKRQIFSMVQANQITPEQGKQMLMELQTGSSSQKEDEIHLYQPSWTQSAIKSDPEAEHRPGNLLIFDENHGLSQLIEEYAGQKARLCCTVIQQGDAYAKLADGSYRIRVDVPGDYEQLLADLKLGEIDSPQILHAWSRGTNSDLSSDKVNEQLAKGFYSLLYLTQALLRLKITSPLPLLYLHTSEPAQIQPVYAAVGALIRTIRLEQPNFLFKSVQLESLSESTGTGNSDLSRIVQHLLTELAEQGGTSREVKYIGHHRYVRSIQEMNSQEFNQEIPLVRGGTYLITGGCGGLGSLVAKHFADRYKANLILNGRSEADKRIDKQLEELQRLGSSAIYVQADLSVEAETKQLIHAAKEKFGALNGIIHCAGLLQDAFILNKKREQAELVLTPKVMGTIHLDEAAKDEELDVFVLFSSISSLLGNIGQSDYAYANAFMDHFAEMRNSLVHRHARHGRTLGINWPLWASGGMEISPAQESWMKNSLDISIMETDQGLSALETSLCAGNGVNQILAVTGTGSAAATGLLELYQGKETQRIQTSEKMKKTKTENVAAHPASPKLKEYAEQMLIKLLAKTTKYPATGIKADQAFEHYGVDSMIVMAMNRELEADFGELSKTLLFEYQNIGELAAYFADNHSGVLTQLAGLKDNEPTAAERNEAAPPKEQKELISAKSSRFAVSGQVSVSSAKPKEEKRESGDIAVIGVSGRYPLARNTSEFWDNLQNGRDCITEIPQDRWDALAAYTEDVNDKSKSYSKWGGFIADADKFDPLFFSISPKEAIIMDPQERIFLETVWQTLEDAGYPKSSLNHAKAGVFVGVMYGQYQLFGASSDGTSLAPTSSYASIANRVSYFFNFHGPSIALDTMCSSSLTAVHLACDSIRSGESEIAVAGGVNLSIHPQKYLMLSQQRFLSTDGRCRTFGEGGDGYVPGEGSGAVLLKPLHKAIADGDRIYAVIKGSTMNHGGKTNGYSVPNPNAQADLITDALKETGIHPRTISYMEAHGTGTSLGDPIEITGLTKAFGKFTGDTGFCAIGSVKSNIGHAESAAGIAGLTKLLLQFQHKLLVPSLHSETPNPNIRFDRSPFSVQLELTEWKRPVVSIDGEEREYPRRAGISAFGAGGANVHVLLEEYSADAANEAVREAAGPQLIILSAQNKERLSEYAEEFANYLNKALNGPLNNTIESAAVPTGSRNQEKITQELASIRSVVLEIAADILQMDKSELDAEASLQDGWLQGSELIRLTEELQKRYAWPSEVHDLITAPSLESVVERIADRSAYLGEMHLTAAAIEAPARSLPDTKNSSYAAPSLADLAYTLQLGREEMEERLALVVSSLTELQDKLSRYVQSGADGVSLHHGNTRAEESSLRLIMNGEEMSALIDQLLVKKELDRLAALWVCGIKADWSKLYSSSPALPKRISLPTYPFAKERYWVNEATGTVNPSGKSDYPRENLHPLLDANVSTLQVQSFSKMLEQRQWHWMDHSVKGRTLWPGAAYLEMARAAGDLSNHNMRVSEIRNVVWRQPLYLMDTPANLTIELSPRDQSVEYNILTAASDRQPLLHNSGELVYAQPDDSAAVQTIETDDIKQNCTLRYDQEQCYGRFEQFGMSYGPAFQSIQELFCSGNEALSLLSLPDQVAEHGSEFGLHPALLDGAFQTVAGIAWANHQDGERPYLPFSAERITLHSHPVNQCMVYVKRESDKGLDDSGFQTVHLYILDLNGQVLVDIQNFTLKRLAETAERTPLDAAAEGSDQELLYCRPVWEEDTQPASSAAANGSGTMLLIGGSSPMVKNLRNSGSYEHIVTVNSGEYYRCKDENSYEVRQGSEQDYGQLLHHLKQNHNLPDTILFACPDSRFTLDMQELSEQLSQSLYHLFAFSKAWAADHVKPNTRLICLYHTERGEPQPLYAALSGFIRTLQLEYPQMRCKVIEVKNSASSGFYDDSEVMIQESQPPLDHDIEVRYEGKRRFVKRLLEQEEAEIPVAALPLVDGGTYIITGGLGGLGFIFARYLAAKARCNLVLTGRSMLNETIESRLSEINGQGTQTIYVQADVTDKEDVHRLVELVKNRFGRIDGLLHSAGNIRDALLVNKSRQKMENVIQPKVHGTLILDEALRHEPLAFFALFSSMVALQGNAGQSDYAYANSFLEHYADVRTSSGRPGKTVVIHWPQWAEGGMKPDEMTIGHLKQAGIFPLGTKQGIEAFELILQSTGSLNVGVLSGNRDKIRESLNRFNGKDIVNTAFAQIQPKANGPAAGNTSNLKRKAEQLLKEAVADIVKLPVARVDIRESFERYGLDSVMSMDLTRELERVFGILPKTLFFEYRTISALADHFVSDYADALTAWGQTIGTQVKLAENRVKEPSNKAEVRLSSTAHGTAAPHPAKRFLKDLPALQSTKEIPGSQDIAIIGLSGKYPMADTLEQFWTNLKAGKDCITEIPADRWDYRQYYDPDKDRKGKSYSKWGGFINDVDKFDPLFFQISPRDAVFMDPQERLFLETVWRVIEDSGYSRQQLDKHTVGMFAGVMYGQYQLLGAEEYAKGNEVVAGSSHAFVANRASYFFNFTGPSIAVDTMCSSSLTAIHLACDSIRRGECELAVAGGVNLSIHPHKYLLLSQSKFTSSDGKCRSFGEGGDGYVPGEGAGAVLLKPFHQAVMDRDNIYGVIKGTALNHGGRTTGVTVPNPVAQGNVIAAALTRAHIDPLTISYIEAHGTGTALGDPLEISGLVKAYDGDPNKSACAIGSVKSNIGHLESAAGIAALTKVLLQLKHRQLVPSIHADVTNAHIKFEDTRFRVQRELAEWGDGTSGSTAPRRAGISSFGAGGSNAHLIVEEFIPAYDIAGDDICSPQIIVLSAKDRARLRQSALQLRDYLVELLADQQQDSSIRLRDIAFTLQAGREAMTERLAMVVHSVEDAIQSLNQYAEGSIDIPELVTGSLTEANSPWRIGPDDEDGLYVQSVINAGNWHKVIRLWVNGTEIDWDLLHGNARPRRISLPGHPFERKRYWIEQSGHRVNSGRAFLHPLIDSVEAHLSVGEGIVFQKSFDAAHPLLNDHRVLSQPVLAGACYLALVRACAGILAENPDVNLSFSQVVWREPLLVSGQSHKCRITLKTQERGGFLYEITSLLEGRTVVHCTGSYSVQQADHSAAAGNNSQSDEQWLPLEEIKQQSEESITEQALYRAFAHSGLSYGPHYQTVEHIWCSASSVLGRISLKSANDELEQETLHPAVLDGALQTIAGFAFAGQHEQRTMAMPFSIERMDMITSVGKSGYAYVQKAAEHKYHIAITDDAGRVCIKLYGVTVREPKHQEQKDQSSYYVPDWQEAPEVENRPEASRKGGILIVSSPEDTAAALALKEHYSGLAQDGPAPLVVQLDSGFVRTSADEYPVRREWLSLDTRDASALKDVLDTFRTSGLAAMYFLAGLHHHSEQADSIRETELAEELGVISLFRILKVLSAQTYASDPIEIKVVTANTFKVEADVSIRPQYAALHGLVKSAGKEFPHWQLKYIDLDLAEAGHELHIPSSAWVSSVISEPGRSGDEVAIRQGQRYVRTLVPAALSKNNLTLFRDNGVYLILGGAGGIGLELSRYLAEKLQARITLVGRRKLGGELAEQLKDIEALGGEVLYVQADAMNIEDMRQAVQCTKQRFGTINGVIHSAIVLEDRTLVNLDEPTFRKTLGPKVSGSVILNEAVKDEPLDFMLFFSSAQSFIGSRGQSNYAAACTFKDAFAQYLNDLRSYPVKIVNWGYWGTVGAVSGEQYSKRLEAQGIFSIQPAEGMDAIERILTSPFNQVAYVKADPNAMRQMGAVLEQQYKVLPQQSASVLGHGGFWLPEVQSDPLLLNRQREALAGLEALAVDLLVRSLRLLGLTALRGQQFERDELRTRLGIDGRYFRLFDSIIALLTEQGLLEQEGTVLIWRGSSYSPTEDLPLDEQKLTSRRDQLLDSYPELGAFTRLLWACLQSYPGILTGRINPVEIMFPKGSKSLVEDIYKGHYAADYYNRLVADTVQRYVKLRSKEHTGRPIRILEVGAGTGGTSRWVLEALQSVQADVQYVYTDISPGFLAHGRREYGDQYPFIEFTLFNAENEPQPQGLEAGSIDLVLATNVLHATKDVGNTLQQLKTLLKPSGLIVINELTANQVFSTLTFGLTDGWWLFNDAGLRLPGSPLLSVASWSKLLNKHGYRDISVHGFTDTEPERLEQAVIIAVSDGVLKRNTKTKLLASSAAAERSSFAPLLPASPKPKAAVLSHPAPMAETAGKEVVNHVRNVREEALKYVKRVFADVLHMNEADFDIHATFETYGVDSLVVMDINKQFEQQLGTQSSTLLFEYKTIDALAEFFSNHYALYFTGNPVQESPEKATQPLPGQDPALLFSDYHHEGLSSAELVTVRSEALPKSSSQDIAIIGLSGKYPGAETQEQFWELLRRGDSAIREIPHERWDSSVHFSPDRHESGKSYSKWGGFIEGVDTFDPLFFNITPAEAETMDPQERQFLQTVWSLFEDAGYTSARRAKDEHKVGVFAGAMNSHYEWLGGAATASGSKTFARSSYWSIANRISYFFNLLGPSMAVDTACSSSLTAIHLACESIRRGECRTAVAGGVNLILHPVHYERYSMMNMISGNDECRSFGEGADGFVDGEGVGAVLLKPLEEAIRDENYIYGIIKGSGINAGGKTGGYLVPNPSAQAGVIRETLMKSGIEPESISYIEAHGTGTALGDPIEIAALNEVFGKTGGAAKHCAIGSVKSNIGHLESASGIAGLTKVLLQMKHRQLVPSLHSLQINPRIKLEGTPFSVQQKLEEWTSTAYPRRAGLSSFGAGGANAHLVIEEYDNRVIRKQAADAKAGVPQAIILSAKDEEGLKRYVSGLADHLKQALQAERAAGSSQAGALADRRDILTVQNIAYTLQLGREAMEERLAFVVSDIEELLQYLHHYIEENNQPAGMYSSNIRKAKPSTSKPYGDPHVSQCIREKRLDELVRLWTEGTAVPWEELYAELDGANQPAFITLSPYPFARERYWIPDFDVNSIYQDNTQTLQPVLGDKELLKLFTEVSEGTLDPVQAEQRIGGAARG